MYLGLNGAAGEMSRSPIVLGSYPPKRLCGHAQVVQSGTGYDPNQPARQRRPCLGVHKQQPNESGETSGGKVEESGFWKM